MADIIAPLRGRERQQAAYEAAKEILDLEREKVLKRTQYLRAQRLAEVRDEPAALPNKVAKPSPSRHPR